MPPCKRFLWAIDRITLKALSLILKTMLLSDQPTAIAPIGEKRITLRNLDWQKYQQMRQLLGDRTSARLTYDRGTLEITMPLEEHETTARLIERFILILVFELGLKMKTMGSTTLNREDLDRGAEPDNCYYIQNQPKVAGRRVNLATDPP
ncbi:MAG TPA: Uma2 family endonuclease, partial [Thermosynechococcaceae cyanobacterium]